MRSSTHRLRLKRMLFRAKRRQSIPNHANNTTEDYSKAKQEKSLASATKMCASA